MFFKKIFSFPFDNKLDNFIANFYDGKISSILEIFAVFFQRNEQNKMNASKFLLKLIKENSFNECVKIAEHLHGSYYWYHCNVNWKKIKIEQLFTTEMSLEEEKAVLIFATFHASGYLREKALKKLVQYPNTLQYILIRRNDWVREIRECAKKLLKDRYDYFVEGELICAIPAMKMLVKGKRDSFMEEYVLFVTMLQGNDAEMKIGLDSQDPSIRLFCAELLLKKNNEIEWLKSFLAKEKMQYVRETLYKNYIYNYGVIDHEVLEIMLVDRCSKIRIMGLDYIHNHQTQHHDFIIKFLLDTNKNIRDFARSWIIKIDNTFSFRNFYLQELQNKNILAIAGIGETGVKEDAPLIEKYLNAHEIKVVKMTLNALIKLDKKRYIARCVSFLNDNRVGIVKYVSAILSHDAQYYEEEIKQIFKHSKQLFVKLKCAKLLFSVSKWNALHNMILALDHEDSIISDAAKQSIENWVNNFNRSFVDCPVEQKEMIKESILCIKRKDIDLQRLLYYLL